MTIEESKVVDILSIDPGSGGVVLSIADHLSWDDADHLWLLQEKLNSYLSFIESGEIYSSYPNLKGRPITIEIVFKFEPSQAGLEFLKKAELIVQSAGFRLRYRVCVG